jgi:hypothetical protein
VSDSVNHPAHYNAGRFEVIEVIEDQGHGRGFCLGNAMKYICRAGKKDSSKELEDLKKARWYLSRYIEVLEAREGEREVVRPNDMNPRAERAAPATGRPGLANWVCEACGYVTETEGPEPVICTNVGCSRKSPTFKRDR